MEKNILGLLNTMGDINFRETLGLNFIEFNYEKNSCVAEFIVTKALTQPMGLLNGGASAGVMETVGSSLSSIYIDISKEYGLGLSLNLNHIRSAKIGVALMAYGEIIHKGRKTHIVRIDIKTKEGKVISSGTLTNIILPIENL